MSDKCLCPVVEIACQKPGQVSEGQMRRIADDLRAQVTLTVGGSLGTTLWGKHRSDCPCGGEREVKGNGNE